MTDLRSQPTLPVAVITGAGGGIGVSIVKKFLERDYFVVACTRSNSLHLEELSNKGLKDSTSRLIIEKFDINDLSASKEIVQKVFQEFKRVDVLVNCAALPLGQLFLLSKPSDLYEVFQTNFFSLLSFTQVISRIMGRKKKGSIINISSVTAFRADPGTLAYGSSKAALNYATRVLSKELAAQGIRVNAVAPGVTDTAMLKQMDASAINDQLASSSLKKIAMPSEIASVVMFLCSEESSHITGQIIKVDGGQ